MDSVDIRITGIELAAVKLPLERPQTTAIHRFDHVAALLVTITTDAGITGEGYAFSFDIERMQSIAALAQSLKKLYIGRDPHDVEALWAETFRSLNFYGQGGIAVIAMTPFDVACWDIIGKAAQRPLYQLFGACRSSVPIYASGGLWLSSTLEELGAEAKKFLAQGFRAMKLRLGSPRWQQDVARVECVRDAIGEDIALMVDANQGLTPDKAIRLGRALEKFNLVWFEEPLPTWDDAGNAALTAALDTAIASGETEYTRYGVRRMVEARAANIMMPDLQRMGGYTEMRKVAGYLATRDVPISPHIFTEHSMHIVASAQNGLYCESFPWFEPLFQQKVTLDSDGRAALPKRPGVGFEFDWNRLESLRVALHTPAG
ncbi:mandelate racemase/muconate lactonizing enzyme family protein [Paraburkholderia fungorum]|jgi:L-alanine-DL-glutamate epimerase-like enolase superfamily enzyme|uniref:mandelate racemase/muconate lactonizing enzyme family protein n=1 Tax=Paraburkholderia fungorum TaxID=134537 RepID=UPI0038B7CC16